MLVSPLWARAQAALLAESLHFDPSQASLALPFAVALATASAAVLFLPAPAAAYLSSVALASRDSGLVSRVASAFATDLAQASEPQPGLELALGMAPWCGCISFGRTRPESRAKWRQLR